jgi:DNA-binding transcriptional ArsR family regulator
MQDVCYIEAVEQAVTLLKPQRLEILRRLDVPRTCPELADYFDDSPQKVYYHVKALEQAHLVAKVDEKRVRGTVEGYYQAAARSYWIAPSLVGLIGGPRTAGDRASLSVLLDLAEAVIADAGKLGSAVNAGERVPSLSLSAHLDLVEPARRAEFLAELQTTFQQLATKYGISESDAAATPRESYRLVLLCYPQPP